MQLSINTISCFLLQTLTVLPDMYNSGAVEVTFGRSGQRCYNLNKDGGSKNSKFLLYRVIYINRLIISSNRLFRGVFTILIIVNHSVFHML